MNIATVRALEPKALWNHFADLHAVPRASKKEERGIALMKKFSEALCLPTPLDHAGNVMIKKPGTKGKDIHPGFGNANKPMNRLPMHGEAYGMRIDTLDGRSLRNASPWASLASTRKAPCSKQLRVRNCSL
jgi:hypothetical protein